MVLSPVSVLTASGLRGLGLAGKKKGNLEDKNWKWAAQNALYGGVWEENWAPGDQGLLPWPPSLGMGSSRRWIAKDRPVPPSPV